MSRDIKSYFKIIPKSTENSSKRQESKKHSLSSDEEDASTSNKFSKGNKKSKKKIFSSDSEEEAPARKTMEKKPVKLREKKEKSISVSACDIFGSKPVKRTSSAATLNKLVKKEAEYHKDSDFEKTLIQLDTSATEIERPKSDDVKDNGKRKYHEESSRNDKETKKKQLDSLPTRKIDENGETTNKNAISKNNENEKPRNALSKKSKKDAPSTKTDGDEEKLMKNLPNTKKSNSHKAKAAEIKIDKHGNKEKIKNDDEDAYGEIIEKKKQRAALYNQYLQRGGARNPGSKKIPEGASNCLAGLAFLITGVLDSLEREEAEELIQKYGGRTVKSISKKTDYMVVGDAAGAAKLEKAANFGTKQISEDELLNLIETRPANKSSTIVEKRTASSNRKRSRSSDESPRSPKKLCTDEAATKSSPRKKEEKPNSPRKLIENSLSVATKSDEDRHRIALVEKYRPKTMSKIIGQHGDKSNAKKLYAWLTNWHKNQNGSVKPSRPNPFAKNDDGAFYKACLLSGPPGIGKTTTAQVVCAELGFDLLEFNASDTRNKKSLKEEVSGILSNNTVKGYFSAGSDAKLSKKHALLMDEVDGMAGNEDRGGLQELISLIKNSEVPIICVCNDRNNPKMRTLSNYTFDLRFPKPRLEQIRGAMKSMCHKENINVTTEDIDRLIQSTNQDIRQTINQLAILATSATGNCQENVTKVRQTIKDLKLGPWDVVRKVFAAEEHRTMSIHDKSDLFFHDYSIAALFVQENYLSVVPNAPKDEILDRIACSAESLAIGDLIENAIRGQGAWSMLPTQACFSSVIPGTLMSGRLAAQANFPSWLGRNSKAKKFDRLLQEITLHARLTTSASKDSINLDYLKHLRDAIVRPLVVNQNDGIEDAMSVMNAYHLLREDVESLTEVSLWTGQRDPLQTIDSKVKAAFTRTYNKSSAPLPYLLDIAPKKKSNQASQDEGFMEGDTDNDDTEYENDDVGYDRMIKAKKATANKKTSSNKAAVKSTQRGRGRTKD